MLYYTAMWNNVADGLKIRKLAWMIWVSPGESQWVFKGEGVGVAEETQSSVIWF